MIRSSLIALLAATPAFASDVAKVPAPEYFVTSVMAASTAQMLAVNCPTLSIHLGKAATMSENVLVKLTQDGFEPSNLEARMEDPSNAIAALQDAFVAKHGLVGEITQEAICAAGETEIAEGTSIGSLLIGEGP